MRAEDNENELAQIREAVFASGKIEYLPPADLVPYPGNARTHDEHQIDVLKASLNKFGFVSPVLIDSAGVILAGHGRVIAAIERGFETVPTLCVDGLTPDQLRAYRLADNRIAELAGWDNEILAIELQHLMDVDVDFSVEITGWNSAEIDAIILDGDKQEQAEDDAADAIPEMAEGPVSREGDLWQLGLHRLVCGSALDPECYRRLLGDETAVLVCQDPPWNIPVKSISGSGKVKHREFVMASGEMSEEQYRDFLERELACNLAHAAPGTVLQVFIDWRGVEKVITAANGLGLELINIPIWHKGHGSFGSPWRSAHEMIVCLKVPGAPIKDRVEMGKHGRIRSNVFDVPGMGSFGSARDEALNLHPTSKPVKLLTELIRDVTDRGDIVLDSFMGSGSTLIAAHRTGRIARGIELDPLYVDTIVRRWQDLTGEAAVLDGDGRSFDEIANSREPFVRQRTRQPMLLLPAPGEAEEASHD